MNKRKVIEIIEHCLNEMFLSAEPSYSWDKVKKRFGKTSIPVYRISYLPEDKYMEIIQKYKKKLPKIERNSLSMTCLNYAPTCNRNDVLTDDEILVRLI